MIVIICFLAAAYSLLIVVLGWGYFSWQRKKPQLHSSKKLSVVVPVRNDAANLDRFLSQDHLFKNPDIEIIVVDDHSTDHLDEILRKHSNSRLKNISLQNAAGKKAAIYAGAKAASHPFILTTDADAEISEGSLCSLRKNLNDRVKLWVVPIEIKRKASGLITELFDNEFRALQFVTFGSLGCQRPLLANGAGMVVQREVLINSYQVRKDLQIFSGDDVFLLRYVAEEYGNEFIAALPSDCAIACKFPETPLGLWQQRLRWVAKTPAVSGFWFQLVAVGVLLANLGWLIAVFVSFVRPDVPLTAVIAKPIVDLMVLVLMRKRITFQQLLTDIFLVLLYPFYLILLSLISQLRPKQASQPKHLQSKWR